MDDAPATPATIAYFSMEVAIDDGLPTYSGGLGVLAGDHLRSAADLGLPVVGVTLRYRDGYFRQRLDGEGHQVEQPVRWSPEERLELLTPRVAVRLRDRPVEVAVWRLVLVGATGHQVPVYLLDTALSENDEGGRDVTDQLYGGDLEHRLAQEVVLGLGGPPLLAQLGHRVGTFHMNEGHSAL
ncbi:MAG TPA: glycogen/starch/alpha-glucan phosphorylase, partial [Acidimicrobiales bacterium]|nr:glycogen/starch/alpha-glucan phosphorylase [Acidimicrobiales bacterium]